MTDELMCSICEQNKLVNELERMSGICDECSASGGAAAYFEQDFDETMFLNTELFNPEDM